MRFRASLLHSKPVGCKSTFGASRCSAGSFDAILDRERRVSLGQKDEGLRSTPHRTVRTIPRRGRTRHPQGREQSPFVHVEPSRRRSRTRPTARDGCDVRRRSAGSVMQGEGHAAPNTPFRAFAGNVSWPMRWTTMRSASVPRGRSRMCGARRRTSGSPGRGRRRASWQTRLGRRTWEGAVGVRGGEAERGGAGTAQRRAWRRPRPRARAVIVGERTASRNRAPSWPARTSWRVQGLRRRSHSPSTTASAGKPLREAACSISERAAAERGTSSGSDQDRLSTKGLSYKSAGGP